MSFIQKEKKKSFLYLFFPVFIIELIYFMKNQDYFKRSKKIKNVTLENGSKNKKKEEGNFVDEDTKSGSGHKKKKNSD
jgi:hypothetical protein